MQSGIVFGYIGLIEKIVAEISAELEGEPTIVATGGYADMFAREIPIIQVSNPDLSLTGLRLIYEMNIMDSRGTVS